MRYCWADAGKRLHLAVVASMLEAKLACRGMPAADWRISEAVLATDTLQNARTSPHADKVSVSSRLG